MCDYRRGTDWCMGLLTTYIHQSELQLIKPPLLISTVHRLPQHPLSLLPVCCVNSHSLVTSSNSGDSSASRAHVVTARRISYTWTLSARLGSLLYSLGADPTENTASISFSIVVMGGLPSESPDIVSTGTCLPSRCSETAVCLSAYCIATAVLVRFEVSAHKRTYMPQYYLCWTLSNFCGIYILSYSNH
jgi:hypothetical protein